MRARGVSAQRHAGSGGEPVEQPRADRDPVNQRWQQFMSRLFEPVPDLKNGERFAMLKEVFYLE